MSQVYFEPSINETSFNCPHCGVRAKQHWATLYYRRHPQNAVPEKLDPESFRARRNSIDSNINLNAVQKKERVDYYFNITRNYITNTNDAKTITVNELQNINIATCDNCSKHNIWILRELIHPEAIPVTPHTDLPDEVSNVFREAAIVLNASPRASAALARLALQVLCKSLGCVKKDINDQIGELVEKGLNPDIQKMLDGIRVVGNNAVHPGTIILDEDRDTARFLLECINRICQRMITEPREANELYDMLPAGVKNAIDKRDKGKLAIKADPSTPAVPAPNDTSQ